jgi:hypothetical protein
MHPTGLVCGLPKESDAFWLTHLPPTCLFDVFRSRVVLDVADEEQPSARAILADLRFKAWLWGVGCHTVVIRYSYECKANR